MTETGEIVRMTAGAGASPLWMAGALIGARAAAAILGTTVFFVGLTAALREVYRCVDRMFERD